MDFNFITPRLATGSMPGNLQDGGTLCNAGFKVVVSACEADTGPFVTPFGIEYLHNPTPDDGAHKDVAWFQCILDFVLPRLILPHYRVLIHCGAGINRGPSGAYVVMRALGYHPDDALQLIRAKRFGALVGYAKDADAAIKALGFD